MADAGGGKKRGPGGGGGGPGKKHKAGWGNSTPKDPSQKAIPPDAWGMLLTCQFNKDKRAVDEARLLFEEAYARMGKSDVLAATRTAGSQKEPAKPAGGASGGEGGGGSKSVEAMLAAEVAELREPRPALFPWHATGVPNTIFVIFPRGEGAPSPSDVAANVAAHVKATKQLPARFLNKLLPVEASCFVGIDEIKKLADAFVPQHFPTGEDVAPLTFGVDVERRSCSKFDQKEVIDAFAKAVPAPHKVNLSKPDRTILVQLVRNVCAVAVAPRFKELCKYNVRVAAEPEEEEGGAAAGGGEAGGANAKAVGGGAKDQQQQQQEGKQQAEEQQQEKEDAAAAAADAAAKEPVPA